MTDLDHDVRDALHRLAGDAGTPRGEETADAAATLAHRQGRARLALTAGALAVALLGAAAPAVLPDAGPAPGQVATDRTEQASPPLYDLPTRGSLADDEAFLDGVAAIEWSAPLGIGGAEVTPPASTRRVLFAGDLPGDRRWALVIGKDEGRSIYAWFGGPAGAAPGELAMLAPPERAGRRTHVRLLDVSGTAPLVVVVTTPQHTARYSPGTVRRDDGSVGHVWTDLPRTDGVLVAEVGAPWAPGSEVLEVAAPDGRSSTIRGLPSTDATPGSFPVLDDSVYTDPAAQAAFGACLEARGYYFQVSGGGIGWGPSAPPPSLPAELSDEEHGAMRAAERDLLAPCFEQAGTGE